MIEHSLGGREYRIRKLDTFNQAIIAKRVLPIFTALMRGHLERLRDGKTMDPENPDVLDVLESIEPILGALSGMSDDDLKVVIKVCLSAVSVRVAENTYQSLSVVSPDDSLALMYPLELAEITKLTQLVINHSIGNFTNALSTLL